MNAKPINRRLLLGLLFSTTFVFAAALRPLLLPPLRDSDTPPAADAPAAGAPAAPGARGAGRGAGRGNRGAGGGGGGPAARDPHSLLRYRHRH